MQASGAATGKQQAVSAFQDVEKQAKATTDVVSGETARQQKITTDHLNYKINQTKAGNAAIAAEEISAAKDQASRFAVQQRGLEKAFSDHYSNVQAQTKKNSQILSFAQSELQKGQDGINRVLNAQKYDDAARGIKQLTTNTEEAANGMGLFGRAFRGAFVGAIAGIATAAVFGTITGIIDKSEELIVQSVQYASAFQMRENAMSLYAGSLNNASNELDRIDKLALGTTGLRLDDAETGSLRLKALGIEGKTVDNVLIGLSKQKLIFGGVNEQQIQRVLLHFDQLAGGASNTGQIIKNIIRDMPGLSRVINDTFGSVQNFKAALSNDSDTALAKFAKGMADAKAPAGGLQNAIEKLEDRIILAERSFGEPILDPLMTSVSMLTDLVTTNSSTWASWGQTVADAITGANDIAAGAKDLAKFLGLDTPDDQAGYARQALRFGGRTIVGAAANIGTGGVSGFLGQLSSMGAIERRNAEIAKLNDPSLYGAGHDARLMSRMGYDPNTFIGPVSDDMAGAKEAEAQRLKTKAAHDAEIQREHDLASSKAYEQRDQALLKDSIAVKEKAYDSYHRYTSQQELDYQKGFYALKGQNIDREIALDKLNFKRRKDLAGDDKVELEKIGIEEVTSMSKLENQKAQNAIDAAIYEREQTIKIEEERRQALIQGKQIEVNAIKQAETAIAFDISQRIDHTGQGYQDLIRLTEDSNAQIVASTMDAYALQLQDQKLTAEQRVNIEKQMQLEISDLNEQTREKVITIQKQQYQQSIASLQNYIGSVQTLMQTDIAGMQALQDRFKTSVFFGQGIRSELGLNQAFGKNADTARDAVTGVEQGKLSIYQAQEAILDKIHQKQAEAIDAEIRGQQTLFKEQAIDGTHADLEATRSRIRNLELQKSILAITQFTENEDLKMASDLDTINGWTERILKGERDIVIAKVQQIDTAQEYQKAALEYRTQTVTLGNAELLNLMRQTEHLKVITGLRNEELQAVYEIDKAQAQINRQYEYSANRSNAMVADFIAQQKGLTEIIADARIGMLNTAYSGLEAVADRLTRKFGAFRDVIKDLVANMLKLVFNKFLSPLITGGAINGGGASAGGGNVLGQFLGIASGAGRNAFGSGIPGMGPGGTPLFNPNAGSGIGGGLIDPVTGLPAAAGSVFNVGSDGGLLSPGSAQAGTMGGTLGSAGTGGITGAIAGMLPFLGAGIGSSLGGKSTLGSILGGVGGGVLGLSAAALLTPGLFGTGAFGAAIVPLLTNPFTIAAAAALIPLAIILGKNKARREDEKTHDKAMVDALGQMDKLIDDVNADRIDGASALSQADQIKQKYLDTVNQLKDKKTRQHAIADGARLDDKIASLKQAVAGQVARKDRLDLMAPTFADGGSVSAFMSPVGYQFGYGGGRSDNQMGYFPAAGSYAKYSPTEYILDAETTRNVGVGNLDTMRATKGMSFRSMREQVSGRASGGTALPYPLPSSSNSTSSGLTTNGNGQLVLELSLNVGIAAEQFVQIAAATVKDGNGSQEQLIAILKTIKNDGQHPLVTELAKQLAVKFNS